MNSQQMEKTQRVAEVFSGSGSEKIFYYLYMYIYTRLLIFTNNVTNVSNISIFGEFLSGFKL